MKDEIILKNGQRIKVGAPARPPPDPKKKELYDQLIDMVKQHAFANQPLRARGGDMPEPPEIKIMDRDALYEELGNCIDIWGKSIISPARGSAGNLIANPPASGKTFDEEAAEEADRRKKVLGDQGKD